MVEGLMMVLIAIAAADPVALGHRIAQQMHDADAGFGDTSVELTMTLTATDGRTRIRALTWRTLEIADDGDKSLTVFHAPPDIEGTAFLSVGHVNAEDEQWLYLPALKRTKRISAANKTGAFVGSELSYEDLVSDELERYAYRWLRDEACSLGRCHVIERVPHDPESGYSRQEAWIDRTTFRLARIDFYDRHGEHLKTLTFADYRRYRDQFWRAHRLHLTHRSGRTTVLEFNDYSFQTGLSDSDFSPVRLKRTR